jgi:hypothetical protein
MDATDAVSMKRPRPTKEMTYFIVSPWQISFKSLSAFRFPDPETPLVLCLVSLDGSSLLVAPLAKKRK